MKSINILVDTTALFHFIQTFHVKAQVHNETFVNSQLLSSNKKSTKSCHQLFVQNMDSPGAWHAVFLNIVFLYDKDENWHLEFC